MPRQSFRLQRVLEYREMLEEQLQLEVAKIKTNLAEQEKALKAKHDKLSKCKSKLNELQKNATSVSDYKTYMDYIGYLLKEIMIQEKVIMGIQETLATTIEGLKKACQDKHVLEKLKGREATKISQEHSRKEQIFFNELGLKSHSGSGRSSL